MKSKNQHLNRTLNSLDEVHSLTMYPDGYNVRHIPRPKAVTGLKLQMFETFSDLQSRGEIKDYRFYIDWFRSIIKLGND